jgi:hypothetical protein
VTTFADRGCRVVSATDPKGRILDFKTYITDHHTAFSLSGVAESNIWGPNLYSNNFSKPMSVERISFLLQVSASKELTGGIFSTIPSPLKTV